jgi:NAD(P)-dependent dehydrogenase (short-subunit alcohol dehydrogenase family)
MNLIVTGSSTGIGRALTIHLLEAGHSVWGLARSAQTSLSETQPNFRSSRADVSSWREISAAADEVAAEWSEVDGIIACAGLQGEIGPLLKADPARWSETVRANLDGTYYTIRAFYPLLSRSARRGKIVCLSGGGATKARPNFSAYGVAKTGVVRLVEMLAAESVGLPLDVNAVAPGAINTRLTDEVIALGPDVAGKSEYESAVKQKASGGGSLEKAIGLITYLLSPASDGLTGRLIAAPWDPWDKLA